MNYWMQSVRGINLFCSNTVLTNTCLTSKTSKLVAILKIPFPVLLMFNGIWFFSLVFTPEKEMKVE